jgi:TolA-binding protein
LLKKKPTLLAEAMLRQGEARFNAKDYDGAEKTFLKVLNDFPKGPTAETASLRLGEMFFQRAEFSRAEAAFAAFLRRWPKSLRRDQALYWIGKTQIRRRQFVLARVSLERLVRDFPKSRLRMAALLEIGHAYYNEGRFQESSAAYRRVLSEKPNSDEAREARYGMVLTRLRSGNTEDFIRDVRSFIQKEKDPKLVNALEFQVGEIFLAQKRYPAALAAYLRVLRRGGEDSDAAHYRIGEIKQMEGKPAEAAEYFQDLLQKFPNSRVRGDARFRLAESLATSGNCKRAMREYRAFILENPNHSLLTQGRYGAGACALRLKDKDAAEKFFSQTVQGGGSGTLIARSHYELGRIARDKGRFAVSLKHMQSAIKGGVNRKLHPRIQFELGSLHQSLKQYPRAVVEFLKVAYLYPKEKALGSQALFRVAGIYELQGKKTRALGLYRKVVKESSTPSVRKLARKRIELLEKTLKSKPAKSAGGTP